MASGNASNVPPGSAYDPSAPWNLTAVAPTCHECGDELNDDGECGRCALKVCHCGDPKRPTQEMCDECARMEANL